MQSQTNQVSRPGLIISAIAWAAFAVAMVFWRFGTQRVSFGIALIVVLPYLVLLLVSPVRAVKRWPWLPLATAFLIGILGSSEYCRLLLLKLSTVNEVVFWYIPAFQIGVVLLVWLIAALLTRSK